LQSSGGGIPAPPAADLASLHIMAVLPSLYAALGIITQRKPNQDKGFKDLPLIFEPVFPLLRLADPGTNRCYAS
jgi:hypothetical protein